jgi:hypothetical protein
MKENRLGFRLMSLCLHVHVSMSMFRMFPCLCLHVSMFSCLNDSRFPCLHVSGILHIEQTVNKLRKIAWASVFRLKRQHIYVRYCIYVYMYICTCVYVYMRICVYVFVYTYVYVYMNVYNVCICKHVYVYIIRKTELTGNGNFRLFAANGKWKR